MSEPQGQSALHHWHLEAGAHLETFSGWQMPAQYTEEPTQEIERVRAAAGVSDASALTKLDVWGGVAGLSVEAPARLWVLTPNHAMITSPERIGFVPSSTVTDVTSVYSAILLAGARSRQVLQKLTTLNLRDAAMVNGAARQARIAHVNAILLRVDSSRVPGFLILNTRDLAEHVWETLLEAGKEFGAAPFGTVAQQQWLGAS